MLELATTRFKIVDVEPAPPTVVSVEWDFGYGPLLLDRSPGVIGVDELDRLSSASRPG